MNRWYQADTTTASVTTLTATSRPNWSPTTATTVDASTKMKDPVLATIGLELVPHG